LIWSILVVAFALLSPPIIEAEGEGTCPSPAAVVAALTGLLAPRETGIAPDVVRLRVEGSSAVISLSRSNGSPIGEKRLLDKGPCADRAREAAVVVAAWEARLATPADPLIIGDPRGGAVERPPTVSHAARADLEEAGMAGSPSRRGMLKLELGAAVAASLNGTSVAPAAVVELDVTRDDHLLVPALAALVVGTHEIRVGPGTGRWRRFGLLAGIGLRKANPTAWVEARISAALTVLDIVGSSFSANTGGISFDPGVSFGVRTGLRASTILLWTEATAAVWPRGQAIYVDGTSDVSLLPRAEVLFGLGAAYGLRR
jgi:hypothetical protein